MRQYHHQCTTQCYLRWDHPREYGENSARCPLEQTHAGPSPRIRGKCSTPPNTADEPGTIPANTGKMRSCPCSTSGTGDHPREYGENRDSVTISNPGDGPSPRIRGKYRSARRQTRRLGTIPANTGKIWSPRRLVGVMEDHPREYGENTVVGGCVGQDVGPSPRIRGKYGFPGVADLLLGTIPANTGRIRPSHSVVLRVRDHPREYGENIVMSMDFIGQFGPSPRIRGEFFDRCSVVERLTDHPREYGENPLPELSRLERLGPSPRIRGEFSSMKSKIGGSGTIPANTGRIGAGDGYISLLPDHPREYGENVRLILMLSGGQGPSPRIRGEFQTVGIAGHQEGTIPANTGRIWS